ncbi:MAG: gas vesicle protein GvpN, partial [Gemmataceae bacterium]|nr:gas vesicle protein GvpN [Gemmataceae bacterium]
AMHIAAELGRPVMLIHGDDEFGSSDLIGGETGYRSTKVVDNFIRSVVKKEENVSKTWVDNRLTTACKYGLTLIYDEFNRSRPEANNVLLSILEERLLELPSARFGEGYLQVHPEFRAIFTSNPEEYAGVHKTQDALLDRMITIRMGTFDRDSEVAIAVAKSGLPVEAAAKIVAIVRTVRALPSESAPTVRACIMIARLTALRGAQVDPSDQSFVEVCRDVLSRDAARSPDGSSALDGRLPEIITQVCGATRTRASFPTTFAVAVR